MKNNSPKILLSIWHSPRFYTWMGFIFVAGFSLLFFLIGIPHKHYSHETKTITLIWEGQFQPFFLYFILGAGISIFGYYKNTLLAWIGSVSVIALSLILIFSEGLLILPGAIFLLVGVILRTFIKI